MIIPSVSSAPAFLETYFSTVAPSEFNPVELSEVQFHERFNDADEVIGPDELFMHYYDDGEDASMTTMEVGAGITLFAIGDDQSFFGYHMSTLAHQEEIDKETVLSDFEDVFMEYDIEDVKFRFYLVGGTKENHSMQLVEAIRSAIPLFFQDGIIAGEFLMPTDGTRYNYITANLNSNGELHFYHHM